jgi:hypothetical protein
LLIFLPDSSSSSSSSIPPTIAEIKSSELLNPQLIGQGGSKLVYKCNWAQSQRPVVYYCYLKAAQTDDLAVTRLRKEFDQEFQTLCKPALQQHPNLLKVLAVRFFSSFLLFFLLFCLV